MVAGEYDHKGLQCGGAVGLREIAQSIIKQTNRQRRKDECNYAGMRRSWWSREADLQRGIESKQREKMTGSALEQEACHILYR